MKATCNRLRLSSCCHCLTTKWTVINGVYFWIILSGLCQVDEWVDVLYIYSTSGSIVSHWLSWRVVTACRYWFTCRFVISGRLSVGGWNAVDMSCLVYITVLTSAQRGNANCSFGILMISRGTPWIQINASKNIITNPIASMLVFQGIQYSRLEMWSMKLTMQLFALKDIRTSVIKSTSMCSLQPCATGIDFSKPTIFPAN